MIKALDEDIIFNELQGNPCKGVLPINTPCPNCDTIGGSSGPTAAQLGCVWGCQQVPAGAGNFFGWPVFQSATCTTSCPTENTFCVDGTPGNRYYQCRGGCAQPNFPCTGPQTNRCVNYTSLSSF